MFAYLPPLICTTNWSFWSLIKLFFIVCTGICEPCFYVSLQIWFIVCLAYWIMLLGYVS